MRQYQELGPATAELERVRISAVELQKELKKRRVSAEEQKALLDVTLGRPRLSETLRELTVALPDEVWISDLELNDSGLLVAGETAASAADLVIALARSRTFTDPHLSGPVSATASGGERFQLSLGIAVAR